MLSRLQGREALLLGVTAVAATVNWWVVSRGASSDVRTAAAD
jgi:hypothetical protein